MAEGDPSLVLFDVGGDYLETKREIGGNQVGRHLEPKPLSAGITANNILHHHGLLDVFGHINFRNPDNIAIFTSGAVSLALDSAVDDLAEFIHREILKQYPEVNFVISA